MNEKEGQSFKISDSLEVRLVHIDRIRERDVNARVMDSGLFDTLTENIQREGTLESLPLLHEKEFQDADYEIISGHHRLRAARRAGIEVIPALVYTKELSEDEVISKQLSHNALSGYDDPETLKRMYDAIGDFEWKVASGVSEIDLGIEGDAVSLSDVDITFDFEPVLIMFLRPDVEKFDELLDKSKSLAEQKYMANISEFRKFSKVVNAVSEYSGIRNIAGIVSIICDLAKERLNQLQEEAEATSEESE